MKTLLHNLYLMNKCGISFSLQKYCFSKNTVDFWKLLNDLKLYKIPGGCQPAVQYSLINLQT